MNRVALNQLPLVGAGMGLLPWWKKGSASIKKCKGKYIHL